MKTVRETDKKLDNLIFLDAVPDGRDAVIQRLHCKSHSLRQRLMELGLNVGTTVRKRSAAGGVICEIGQARFALGKKVCHQIEVSLV